MSFAFVLNVQTLAPFAPSLDGGLEGDPIFYSKVMDSCPFGKSRDNVASA